MNGAEGMTLPHYFEGVKGGLTQAGNTIANLAGQVQAGIQQGVASAMAQGMTQEQAMQLPQIQQLVAQGEQLKKAGASLQATGDQLNASAETLAPYANGMNLKSDQSGWGIAPVIGIDYKIGNFNFAAKYEFKTRMRMKNDSDLKEATVISATNKYVNGTSVPEDSPAQLALGAQWEMTPGVRLNLGYHHFFDKSAHWYEHSEKLLDGDTNEYLAGAESGRVCLICQYVPSVFEVTSVTVPLSLEDAARFMSSSRKRVSSNGISTSCPSQAERCMAFDMVRPNIPSRPSATSFPP
jgi:long-subunit fatty acid transport protein